MARAAVQSILFESFAERARVEHTEAPSYFHDLNLDQIVEAITTDWAEYNLKPFFYVPLNRPQAITYRQEVMRDLQGPEIINHITVFAEGMRAMRAHLSQAAKLHYQRQKNAWFLDAVDIYCRAVCDLTDNLRLAAPRSRGLIEFLEYLGRYVASKPFISLMDETKSLRTILARIRYCVLINGSSFTVLPYRSESDYSAQVQETFDKFARGAVKDYSVKYASRPEMNHIEAKILDYVANLAPEIFADLDGYCANNRDFMDPTIADFDREIHFYVAYLNHVAKLSSARLSFCYPQFSAVGEAVHSQQGFDLALAVKFGAEQKLVCNNFHLDEKERVIVVTGPNQGGKTTFARMFGQLHYLATLGGLVPGQEARLLLFDKLFTQFEREERIENIRGKLQDDLIRVRAILEEATSNSIIILNEVFNSTTLQDAVFLSHKVMDAIVELDSLCVWVTFIDELASFGGKIVSMVGAVVPENPTLRTFKILRRSADGLSYALSIAEKHHLTYERLRERIRP